MEALDGSQGVGVRFLKVIFMQKPCNHVEETFSATNFISSRGFFPFYHANTIQQTKKTCKEIKHSSPSSEHKNPENKNIQMLKQNPATLACSSYFMLQKLKTSKVDN